MGRSSPLGRVDTAVLARRLTLTLGAALAGGIAAYGIALLGTTVGVGMLVVTMVGVGIVVLYLRSTTPSVTGSVRRPGGVEQYLRADFVSENPERLLFVGLGLALGGGLGMARSLGAF